MKKASYVFKDYVHSAIAILLKPEMTWSSFQITVEKPKPAIIPTNHNRDKQHYEPITVPSNYPQLAQSAGKITRKWCDWFWLYFSLV